MLDQDILNYRFNSYRNLMSHRIRNILLVSSVYDAYILEEDGSLEELIWQQYMERGLSEAPSITKVTDPERALEILRTEPVDLLFTMTQMDDEQAVMLAEQAKAIRPDLPVILLAGDTVSLSSIPPDIRNRGVDRVFLWQNDPSLLLAIIKYVEDKENADRDTQEAGVRVILLVEDSIEHYSSFLPAMYTVIMKLTRQLIDEGLNHLHRQLRMRSRVKILLAESYEDAVQISRRYSKYLLGVITDVRFWQDGKINREAGFDLVRLLRNELPELPICIQSAEPEKVRAVADELQTFFIDKNSVSPIGDLKKFLTEFMGFGDFVFRNEDGSELARVGTVREMLDVLPSIPIESIAYHGCHQDFSHWMMARTEVTIAEKLQPHHPEDFEEPEEMRNFLMQVIKRVLHEKQCDIIARFTRDKDPHAIEFMRLGEGSLGGKARGIGFLRFLLARIAVRKNFPDIDIRVPSTLVICSGEFESFIEQNNLLQVALNKDISFPEITQRFLDAPIQESLKDNLRVYLERMTAPLAVRSSSILEDSLHMPLAGLYSTYMLPNRQENLDERLDSLLMAIKLVWVSTYNNDPKSYFMQTGQRLKDERMAVVIQQLGGETHGNYFYPTFSGVAQSHNFYPVSYMEPEDGVVQIALGFGKLVVEGGSVVRFCPRYPQLLPQFSLSRDWLYSSQKDFYALDMSVATHYDSHSDDSNLSFLPLSVAEEHGVLQQVASVYQADSDLMVDSFFYDGPRVVTFNKVLRDGKLQLGDLLYELLSACDQAMGTPVEVEFAVDLRGGQQKPILYLLQLRPMVAKSHWEKITISEDDRKNAICYTNRTHGNGSYEGIQDVVYVKPSAFLKSKTRDIAAEVGEINKGLVERNRPYFLIGFGRWGSSDPWMGIGVRWSQISGVRVLAEAGLKEFNVDPSQGSHFFQNVTSLNIGYLSLPYGDEGAFIDWDWLEAQPAETETTYLRHVRLASPLRLLIDGRSGEALVAT